MILLRPGHDPAWPPPFALIAHGARRLRGAPPPAGRAATWQRIGFQSGDDTVRRPSDPPRYPLAFGANGDVMMQPDRTLGTGSWSAEASRDGQSGSLRIGPLAVTRAMCPAAPMGEQTVRDMDHVRG